MIPSHSTGSTSTQLPRLNVRSPPWWASPNNKTVFLCFWRLGRTKIWMTKLLSADLSRLLAHDRKKVIQWDALLYSEKNNPRADFSLSFWSLISCLTLLDGIWVVVFFYLNIKLCGISKMELYKALSRSYIKGQTGVLRASVMLIHLDIFAEQLHLTDKKWEVVGTQCSHFSRSWHQKADFFHFKFHCTYESYVSKFSHKTFDFHFHQPALDKLKGCICTFFKQWFSWWPCWPVNSPAEL